MADPQSFNEGQKVACDAALIQEARAIARSVDDATMDSPREVQQPDKVPLTATQTFLQIDAASPRAALCLSGGGIRSATFSIGVLQGLARQGILQQFTYLSTVSGGGYAGAWLTAWIRRGGGSANIANELAGAADGPSREPVPVRELRRFSNYLSPRGGLSSDTLSLVSAYLRNLVLNWAVIVPLLLALLLVPRILTSFIVSVCYSKPDACKAEMVDPDLWSWYVVLGPVTLFVGVWLLLCIRDLFGNRGEGSPPITRERLARKSGNLLLVTVAYLLLTLVVLKLPVWLLSLPMIRSLDYPSWVGGGTTALLGLLVAAVGFWSRHGSTMERRVHSVLSTLGVKVQELLAVGFLLLLMVSMSFAISSAAGLVIGSIDPNWETIVKERAQKHADGAALERLKTDWVRSQPDRLLPPKWGCGLNPVPSDQPSITCAGPSEQLAWAYKLALVTPPSSMWMWFTGLCLAALVLATMGWGVSWRFRVNGHSLGEIYERRLTRAYLAASRKQRSADPITDHDPEDDLPLAASDSAKVQLPFLVINTAVNSVSGGGQHPTVRDRRAESFVMTPLHCGCNSLGYVDTSEYAGGITLGRAMAVSGAAASPNMGYHTSAAVGLVLGFFNIRLGAWLPSPKYKEQLSRQEPSSSLDALYAELLTSPSSDTPFLNITDGGHFDNLGLYEMARRRCPTIVVVDATCDPDYEFTDLAATMRKVRVDMGIEIEFPDGLPGPAMPGLTQSGPDARGACVAIGRIRYSGADGPEAPDGRLYYLKPVFDHGVPQDLKDYARESRRAGRPFPQQPTWDQFFDEAQFESYRRLGLHCATTAFPGEGLWPITTHVAALRVAAVAHAVGATGGHVAVAATGTAAPAPESEGLVDRAKQFFHAMSPGEVLASVALAGAITVTGTVTLADRTVDLADRTLTLNASLETQIGDLADRIGAVNEAISPDGARRDGLLHRIQELSQAVDQKPSDTTTAGLRQQLSALSGQLVHLTQLVGGAQKGDASTATAGAKVGEGSDITDLIASVRQLQASVNALQNAIGAAQPGESRETLLAQVNAARDALKQVGDLSGTFRASQEAAGRLASSATAAAGAADRFTTNANAAASAASTVTDAALRLVVTNTEQANLLQQAIKALPAMQQHLRNIEFDVRELPPARTIRGTSEGAGR